jgi:hypothetical protein
MGKERWLRLTYFRALPRFYELYLYGKRALAQADIFQGVAPGQRPEI